MIDVRTWGWRNWLAAALLFIAAGVVSIALPPLLIVLFSTAAALWLALAFDAALVVIPLLLVRAAADAIMDIFTLFGGTPLEMNLAGALNSFTLALGLAYAAQRWLLTDRAGRRQALLHLPGVGWYVAWLLIGLAGLTVSIEPLTTLKEWVRLASGLAIFLLARPLASHPARRGWLVCTIFLSALAPITLALYQLATGSGYFFVGLVGTAYEYRAQGTFGHPAILASFLLVVLALAGALWRSPVRPFTSRRQPPYALIACAAGVVILLTLARAQWLGLWTVLIVLLAVRRPRWVWLAILLPPLLALAPPIYTRLTSAEALDSVLWRWELWQFAATFIEPAHPNLLGLGLGVFPLYAEQALPPRFVAPPHNDYLKVLIETGWLGALAWAGWQISWLSAAARRARHDPFALALLSIVASGLIVSLSDNYVQYVSVQWFVWVVAAMSEQGEERKEEIGSRKEEIGSRK